VYAVIEEDEIRQVVHSCPFDGLSRAETLAYRCQIRTVDKQLGMAIHASLYRRDTRERRTFDGCVTITTVDPVITHVVFVTELNGLLAFGKGARVIRRSLDRRESPGHATKNKNGSKYAHLRKGVRTAMENL
jgi:hypothetical protein